jgi:hypothetical protein
MPYEQPGIDGQSYVLYRDGVEVERRPATERELTILPRVPLDRSDEYATKLREQALTAHAANRTFVALNSPTNAQNAAQIKALTRQINGVIRLLLGQLDGTD